MVRAWDGNKKEWVWTLPLPKFPIDTTAREKYLKAIKSKIDKELGDIRDELFSHKQLDSREVEKSIPEPESSGGEED